MKAPKLSVLIAAYNAEQYLDECIQSVLNQKYSDYEIIIIDDGSTDSTYDICKKYASQSKKIKVHSWENHGLILARRKAIDLASGEYVLFLDADDAYKAKHSKRLLRIYKIMQMLLFIDSNFSMKMEQGRNQRNLDIQSIYQMTRIDCLEILY